ncbi:MAG: hypothetical protein M0Z53_02865 [Thermaerobacter sp.]|nr:hypothetical protein [Thermaerobacter sp.]
MHGIPAWLFGAVSSVVVIVVTLLERIERHLRDIRRLMADLVSSPADRHDALIAQITPLLQRGQKIPAIKVVRKSLGCTLLEAKQFVDDLLSQIS